MNIRLMIIEEALLQGFPVPVDMVLELAASGQDVSALVNHIDGFQIVDTLEDNGIR